MKKEPHSNNSSQQLHKFDFIINQVQYNSYKEVRLYSGQSFFAEVGGMIGLLVGASLLTIYELIKSGVLALKSHLQEPLKSHFQEPV